ncbi:MAG: DNA-methyltransferase [Promethearchaeota archaeon]
MPDLRKNQIFLGNALEILPIIPDKSIDLMITDPPFYIMTKKNIKFKHRTDIVQTAHFDQFDSYDNFLQFTESWLKIIVKKMKDDASAYIFFGAQYITDLIRICEKLNMRYKGIIVWHKTNPAPKIRKSGYLSSTELILFMVKGKPVFNFLGQKKMHNLIETPICQRPERLVNPKPNSKRKYKTLHPTQKPESLIEHLILVSSNPNQLVCDPFAGTGTINKVCQKLNRYCIGIEINPDYYQAAIERLNHLNK